MCWRRGPTARRARIPRRHDGASCAASRASGDPCGGGRRRRGAAGRRRATTTDPLARALLALCIAEPQIDRLAGELEHLAETMRENRDGAGVQVSERHAGLSQVALERLVAYVRDADRRCQAAKQELVEANL